MERLLHEDRFLIVDDSDEDVSQILTVICEGRPRTAQDQADGWTGGGS